MSNELKNFLVLIRHGQSEWNEKNLFTGWKNPPLTRLGELEAERVGSKIKSLPLGLIEPIMNISSFLKLSPLAPYHSLMYGRSL